MNIDNVTRDMVVSVTSRWIGTPKADRYFSSRYRAEGANDAQVTWVFNIVKRALATAPAAAQLGRGGVYLARMGNREYGVELSVRARRSCNRAAAIARAAARAGAVETARGFEMDRVTRLCEAAARCDVLGDLSQEAV